MRKPGSGLTALGLVLILGALSLTGYNLWDGHRADVAAQHILGRLQQIIPEAPRSAQLPAAPTGEPTPAEVSVFSQIPERDMPTMELNGYSYIGILEIPALELSLPVMDTWDYTRLDLSPCRFSGSTYQRNLVICAHNYPKHFRPVKALPLDTQVCFTDADGIRTSYRVCDLEIVGPNDVESMTTGNWDLTLFTCTTGGQTRAAVRCALAE